METVLIWIGHAASVLGLISALVAAISSTVNLRMQRAEERRKREPVKVYVRASSATTIELPLALKRGDFTRAELMGRLGMLAKDQSKNLRIKALSSSALLKQIIDVTEDGASSVIIECEQEELDQIDLSVSIA